MAFNLGAKGGMLIPDSPAIKRQKTNGGYNDSTSNSPAVTGYNSEEDSGDDLLAGYVPDTPKRPHETQATQIIAKGPTSAYETQPTQLLSKPTSAFETQPTQILGRPPVFETQPTQILDRVASSPATPAKVQVPASSPFTGRDQPTPKQPTPQQKQNAFVPPPRSLASAMAPAGTAYKPPAGIITKPTPFSIDLLDSDEDDGPKFAGGDSDSDDGRLAKANIKPSTFAPRSVGDGSFGSMSGTSARPASAFSSRSNTTVSRGNAKFNEIVKNAAYRPGQQNRPDRARPILDISMKEITNGDIRDNIYRIREVFPSTTVHAAREALLNCRGNLDDAMNMIAKASEDVQVISDDELSRPFPPKQEPQMKRGLDMPTKSIRDKYSSTQAMSAHRPGPSTPNQKKRKLMKGRKNVTPGDPSPAKPITVEDDEEEPIALDYETDDSAIASEEEEDPELEARLLKYLNSCSVEDLVELTNITTEISEMMVAARPFRSLDAARAVENSKPLKNGRKSTKAPIGTKIVDTAQDMFSGYEAIDILVSRCEALGKPLAEEMATWGFDVFGASKDGELEMTSLEDEDVRDSGIGSPTSTGSPKDDDEIRTATRKRSHVNFLKKPNMMADDCVLKDYQVVGLNWLALMYRRKLSCILADEMGLGKTCQVIAFLSHLVESGNPGPHLVVCPGSTLENWLRECNRFAPQLVVEPYHGLQKERVEMAQAILDNRREINIVVTTYDMAQKKEDNKFMRRLNPDVCVYDEGHYLKNVNSLRYQGLVKIPATFRLLLTGTPLQNNLQELAALLAFIMPIVFQERAEDLNYIFKAKAKTGDKDHAALLSAQRIARARSMLTPFVLRRKKAQVLKHLPSKTCRVEYATLHETQKKIYDGHINQARERARLRVEGAKIPKNANDENNPLMQLRKAAIHPMLFRRHFTNEKIEKMADILRKKLPGDFPSDKNHKREHLIEEMRSGSDFWLHRWCYDFECIRKFDVPDLEWMNSGKVESMLKLVKQYKENGDRVLIFSQFALVLDILEAVFNSSLIVFTRIDGSTKIDERQSLIDTFRDDESITVFLLTTKAGGTGINLMYANKVIIFDGSFNPQDDRQAENRAHRVGQTRDVEVVRLVTKNTVEEAIYALGQSKLELDGRVAGDDEAAAEVAGEKAVSKMLLEGIGREDEEDKKLDKDVKKVEEKMLV
ncbi:hypothetical protein HYFRA_00013411 [Hymenoscyphus fraxineus]|uniref:DNA helicase n=1 Tax=Hymenoscyphus fraxineus TaxID=746836 RepID=A0A9N9L9P1_9HELO|nr:hypothetical protein HYFRA_00013411 [Hymenoscyphus fraxineus]